MSEGEHGESSVSVGSVTPKAMSKETKQSHVTSQCSQRDVDTDEVIIVTIPG